MAHPAPIPLRILGTGAYLPRHTLDSSHFDQRWGKPAGWTLKHAGVAVRHVAAADEPASWMAQQAAEQALDRAGLRAAQMDAVISACSVGEQAIPCTAAFVHQRLGLAGTGIPAFDVNATCLSFVSALDLAACAIAAGRYRRVLVVASELPSAGMNPDDPDTAPLFGDGAAAVVLAGGDDAQGSALLTAHMETYSEGLPFCQVRSGGTRLRVHEDLPAFLAGARFEMSGRATYKLAARLLPGYLQRLFERAGVGLDDLAAFVPHQASAKALLHLQVALRLPPERLVRILETRGNQMAASIPSALHEAISTGRLQRGDLVALVGSGAGLSFGGAVLRY